MRRRIPGWLLGAVLVGAASVVPSSLAGQGLARLDWLSGCWQGERGAMMFEEQWSGRRDGLMLGVARVSVRDSVVSWEFVRLFERGGHVFYAAQPGGRPPVEFQASELEAGSVRFSNAAHDFPKAIVYRRVGADSLVAHISSDVAGEKVDAQYPMKAVPCAGRR